MTKGRAVLIEDHWNEIKQTVKLAQRSMRHCSIASVSSDGVPNITPIGTVFLRDDQSGFYFDQYTDLLTRNIEINPKICLMAVNTGAPFWLRSLIIGRFISPPGVRLYGTAGPLRLASADELRRVQQRVRATRWLKGSRLLWSNFTHVRDIHFDSFRPVTYPSMVNGLWKQST